MCVLDLIEKLNKTPTSGAEGRRHSAVAAAAAAAKRSTKAKHNFEAPVRGRTGSMQLPNTTAWELRDDAESVLVRQLLCDTFTLDTWQHMIFVLQSTLCGCHGLLFRNVRTRCQICDHQCECRTESTADAQVFVKRMGEAREENLPVSLQAARTARRPSREM